MVAFTSIGLLVLGVFLILVAPKIVGFVIKILGLALLVVGGALYFFPAVNPHSTISLIIAALPAVAGLFLITVGEGMAKMAVRIAGVLMLLSALVSLGVIRA